MKKIFYLHVVTLVILFMNLPLLAQSTTSKISGRGEYSGSEEYKKFGLGINLGEPMGLNARYFLLKQLAVDLNFGYGFGEEGLIIQPSALFYLRDIIDYKDKDFTFTPYFGLGLKTGISFAGPNAEGIAAMRFPIGGSWMVKDIFEITAEFAPGVEFTPETGFNPTGSIGLRYYFF